MRTTAALGLFCLSVPVFAQTQTSPEPLTQDGYILPPKPVADAVLAPWWKNVTPSNFSPDGKHYLILRRDGLPTLASLAKPHVNLAGLDIDTGAKRGRGMTTRNFASIDVVDLATGESKTIPAPKEMRMTDPSWSPDGKELAFLGHFADRTEAWVYDLDSKKSRRVTATPLLATAVNDLEWVDDNRLVAVLVPAGSQAPAIPAVAISPRVAVTNQKKAKLVTYASLLGSPTDATQFEYYTTGQLSVIDVANGRTRPIGKPAMIVGFDPSPDGKYFIVRVMERPFSYIVPFNSFPQREAIWDESGAVKVELNKRGLRGEDEDRGKPTDRRAVAWRVDGAGLAFLQSEPADPKDSSKKPKDRVMLWRPPFGDSDQQTIWSSDTRIGSVQYSPDAKRLFVSQTVDGKNRLSLVDPLSVNKPVVLNEAKSDDDAVSLITRSGVKTGVGVRISPDGGTAYFQGTVYAKDPGQDAPRPFIDKVSLADGKRERIFESKSDVFEVPMAVDDAMGQIVVTRQSPSMVPNSFLVNLPGKDEKRLTENQDYCPDLTQARKEWVSITRADGIKFWAKVTLPSTYVTGAKLPAFFWFYPSEFTGQEAYDKGRRTFNKNLFNGMSPSNKTALIRLGYVLVEPDSPIVGTADRKNDTYVSNLRNDLSAIIDELDQRGYIDRTRLAIGGHSYGAFSTANAMVNTPFFKCGIAGDGNYNRSLTPFGFQNEERQIWEGRDVYLAMSPILYVDQITGALLMYHGQEDQNVGTTPINSERMFAALQANGKPAALYMYPYEDHGQIAQETILDQWARWCAWLDKWLKPKA